MFADFFKRLSAPSQQISDDDARHAIGALLVRLAKADGHYDPREIERIDAALAQRFSLTANEAETLRKECEAIEAEAPDTVRFTRTIKDAVTLEDRVGIIRAMWQIVLTDDTRDQYEDQLMRLVAPMLGITDQESNRIRLEVAGG